MRRFLTAAFLSSAAFLAPQALAQEGGGVELLRAFLEKTPAAQITLSREVLDAEGNKIGGGGAKLALLRPDKFRLEHAGAEELLIVSDGETVWTYEPDLLQAIRRPYDAARQMGALAMLAGDAPEAHFQLSAPPAADENGVRWVAATPRADLEQGDSPALTVRAGFSPEGELAEIQLRDAFGGIVRLVVDGISRAAPDASVFEFEPPAGTDIVSDDG